RDMWCGSCLFFFSSRRRHTRSKRDWSSDVCSSDLYVTWQAVHELREAYQAQHTAAGRHIALKVLDSFHTCPIPEVARLGRTLRRWKDAFLAYFTTDRVNNGPTEALNGIIELHRRLAVAGQELVDVARGWLVAQLHWCHADAAAISRPPAGIWPRGLRSAVVAQ